MTKKQYRILHVGWLLACDAPSNKAKGERLFQDLTKPEQTGALDYAAKCRAVYARGSGAVAPR